ncbi:12296_t:CDS:10 [Entrophospora sp. SA101]|nr:12296_t:CDS:10 [Entrophospora sp. SA101]
MEENNNSYEKNENPNGSNTRIIPTTFLDLLNSTIDDADLVHFRLLSQAQAIGSDLTTGIVAPHLWQNLEQEWSEFNQDLRLTSGIVGEANLHYVNRDYPKAIEVLQEVIKIDPNIHSAWFTLGTIQDEIGCLEKALQLYLVAAHLTPHDGALWKRLDHSAAHQAIYCFSKAIRCDPNDAIDGFTGLLEKVPHDMNILREISKIHVQTSEVPKAIELYLDAYSYYRNRPFYKDTEAEGSFGYSEINIMAELYMLINDFGGAIEFIKCGVRWLQGREDETWWNNVTGTRHQGVFSSGGSNAPLPLELRIKLGISRICMDGLEEGKVLLFEDALTTYEAILLNSETNNPTAWMRVGLCHRELGNFENAAEYFTAVVEDSPDNLDAKLAESTPVRDPVVISLSSSSNSMTLQENQQLDLLYPCSVNGDKEASKEYLETARGLIEDWQNNSILSSKKQGYDRCKSWREKLYYEEIKELKEGYDADIEEQATTMAKRLQWNIDGQLGELEAEIHKKMTEFQGITFEKWFEFFIQFIITATKNGHESEAYDVVMLVSKANIFYHNERHKTTFKVLSLAWGLYTSNYIVVCESARWLSANSQKYFLRQIKAMDSGISDSSPTKPDAGLLTLYGHILGCSRSYNGALGYYARAALVKPKDPLVCFSMGLAYLHRAMQRKTSNRHLQILQGFNFLYEYYELKGKNQEAEYNLGHAFHQLGLTHLAIPHYEKALKLPSVNQILKQKIDKKKQLETDENEEVENFEENDPTDIRKEAAYNLYLIYMETGSPALAQMLLKKYCAI